MLDIQHLATMKIILAKLYITFTITNAFSKDIAGVWEGTAKNPEK